MLSNTSSWEIVGYNLIVVPSITFSPLELSSVRGIEHYEERLLYVILALCNNSTNVTFITSNPIDPYIIEYYRQLVGLDKKQFEQQFRTYSLVNSSPEPLAVKLLQYPRFLNRIKETIDDQHILITYRGMHSEQELSRFWNIPLYSATEDQQFWGTKSGSRIVFQSVHIPHPQGSYQAVYDATALANTIVDVIVKDSGQSKKGIVKLLDGFAGRGNAIISLQGWSKNLQVDCLNSVEEVLKHLSMMDFVCKSHTWNTFEKEIQENGCIFELFVEQHEPGMTTSPSVQLVIDENQKVIVVSTHEQVLDNQSYLGCQFPAHTDYRKEITDYSIRVGNFLRHQGIKDHFSVDFVCILNKTGWNIYAIEINLRLTGTTHPFMAMHLLCQGSLNLTTGDYNLENGDIKCYLSSDHVEHKELAKLLPIDILEMSQTIPELMWCPITKKGIVFHLIGCISQFGTIGITAISDDVQESKILFLDAVKVLKRHSNQFK